MRGKLGFWLSLRAVLRITPAGAGKTYFTASLVPSSKDHPRRCGENPPPPRASCAIRGSPPQVRGKRACGKFCRACRRITPADAGKTQVLADGGNTDEDHPRGCGENADGRAVINGGAGSPPRMRGKRIVIGEYPDFVGITPADAGKTVQAWASLAKNEDHPRGCGENASIRRIPLKQSGSPPRMRGKRFSSFRGKLPKGITPADAGKTFVVFNAHCFEQDHPRGCGENPSCCCCGCTRKGSPPRMRGKLTPAAVDQYGNGITPAGAGETHIVLSLFRRLEDHPRRCGENGGFPNLITMLTGSPPQVRGKPLNCISLFGTTGITPAGAGKTARKAHEKSYKEDHPRRCGENLFYRCPRFCAVGSPPQVRGKPNIYSSVGSFPGITPAGAGKTLLVACVFGCSGDHPRRCGENTET